MLDELVRSSDVHYPISSLVTIENTHNMAGGKPWKITELNDIFSGDLSIPLRIKQLLFQRKLSNLWNTTSQRRKNEDQSSLDSPEVHTAIVSPLVNVSPLSSELLDTFEIVESLMEGKKVTFHYSKDDEHVMIKGIKGTSEGVAIRIIENEVLQVRKLYMAYPSPYPGTVSREVECSEEFQPAFFKGESDGDTYQYLIAYSNERFVVGACSWDLVTYSHLLGWLYCPDDATIYTIKYHIPLEENAKKLENLYHSLKCR